jgi:hypothetical protein
MSLSEKNLSSYFYANLVLNNVDRWPYRIRKPKEKRMALTVPRKAITLIIGSTSRSISAKSFQYIITREPSEKSRWAEEMKPELERSR